MLTLTEPQQIVTIEIIGVEQFFVPVPTVTVHLIDSMGHRSEIRFLGNEARAYLRASNGRSSAYKWLQEKNLLPAGEVDTDDQEEFAHDRHDKKSNIRVT